MKKKIVVIVTFSALLFVLVAGFVAAEELLTLRNAVEQAISGSPGAKLASLGAEKAKLEYEIADEKADLYRSLLNSVEPVAEQDVMFKFLFIDEVAAESQKVIAEQQQEFTRNQLAYEAQKSYLLLYQAHEQKRLMEQTLERAKEIKRIAETGFSVGTIAKSEVMRADSHVATMEATLFGAESGVKIAEAGLNMTLGRELNNPVSLADGLNLPDVEHVDLESGTTRALNDSIDIMKANAGLKIAEGARDYIKFLFGTAGKNYETAEIGAKEAELALQLAKDRVRLEVFSLYQKLTGMEKQLAARQKALDLATENYRISKLRYELGAGTQGEVTDALLALSEQELTLLSDKIEHYTDYLNWRLVTALSVN